MANQGKHQSSDIIKGLRVDVRNGDVNGALRRFKKLVQQEGIIQEVRERQEYVKPSTRRTRAKAAARARWLKKQSKMDQEGGTPSRNNKRK